MPGYIAQLKKYNVTKMVRRLRAPLGLILLVLRPSDWNLY